MIKPNKKLQLIILFIGIASGPTFAQTAKMGEQYLLAAQLAEKQNNLPRALEFYRKSYEIEAVREQAAVGITRTLLQQYDLTEAEKFAKEHLEKQNLFNVDLKLALADIYTRQNKFDHAAKEILVVEKLKPLYTATFATKGRLYFAKKDFKAAERSYTAYLAKQPSDTNIRLARAQCFLNQQMYEQAVHDFKFAANERPNDLEIHLSLVDALMNYDVKEAEKTLYYANKLDPGSWIVINKLAFISEKLNKNDEAKSFYKRYLEKNPSHLSVGLRFGELMYRIKDYNSAETEWKRELKIDKGYDPAARALVRLWIEQSKGDQVGQFLHEYLIANPGRVWAVKNYVEFLKTIGREDRAFAVVKEHLQLDKSLEGYFLKAWAAYSKKDFSGAISVFMEARRQLPKNEYVLYNLGILYEAQNKNQFAIEHYKQVPSTHSLFHKAMVNLALIYEREGQLLEAREILIKLRNEKTQLAAVNAKLKEIEAQIKPQDKESSRKVSSEVK